MAAAVAEIIAEPKDMSTLDVMPAQFSASGPLRVMECTPGEYHFDRCTRSRVSHVATQAEALGLPWIQRLPGKKRIKFLYGQVFVVQEYFGCKLIRAHITHKESCGEPRQEAVSIRSAADTTNNTR